MGNELLPPPPHFPDLTRSDYFLFANLPKLLGTKRFGSIDDIILQVSVYYENINDSNYLEGV